MVLTLTAGMTLQAQTNEFVIQTKKLGAEIQPTMYGLFFEDINYAADGGLYAELVKNRSFEFPQNLMGWKTFGNVTLQDDGPFEKNPHYVRLSDPGHPHKHTGLDNEGFFGIGVKAGEEYRFFRMGTFASRRNSRKNPYRVGRYQIYGRTSCFRYSNIDY